jgi:hypothetical protein
MEMNLRPLKKNKKTIFICIFLSVIIGIMYSERKKDIFGEDIPLTFVISNNTKYKTIHGDGNWAFAEGLPEGNVPGNGYIVNIDKEFRENCSFIEVLPDVELSFDISYKENIQKVTLGSIEPIDSRKMQSILNEPYTFKTPKEKGDYYYILNVNWDENHNFDYLFKIKVI